MRYSRADYVKMIAAQQELARAEADYERLRAAYLAAAHEPGQDVAMAMIGSDMDRAHAVLQSLIGMPRVPVHLEPAEAVQAPVRRKLEEQESA
jgi:hypothetical protein